MRAGVLTRIGERELTVRNLDKLLWPESGVSKGDLIAYYTRVAPALLPHLKDRPLVLTRYPDGIGGEGFYQKDAPANLPSWVRTFAFQHETRLVHYVLADEAATLAFLANLGVVEIHPWTSRRQHPHWPDFALVDLDPAAGATFAHVREVANLVHEALDRLGLFHLVKGSGATGLHIYVPAQPGHTFDDTQAFAHAIGRLLLRVYPERVTLERAVTRRTGKVYVDYLQNRPGATLAGVYSARPHPGAPVSAPLTWAEVQVDPPLRWNLRTLPARLTAVGDLFAPLLQVQQDLRAATRALGT